MSVEPAAGQPCPGCGGQWGQNRYEHPLTKLVTCGWCGYNPKTGEQAHLVPASRERDYD